MKQYLISADRWKERIGGGVIEEISAGLLRQGLVKGVLAQALYAGDKDIRPAFITSEEEIDRITFTDYNPYCLSRLLKEYESGKVVLIGRTCDIRAGLELAKRNQIDLADVYTVGVACSSPGRDFSGEKRSNCSRCEHFLPFMADLNCIITEKATVLEATSDKGTKALEAAQLETVPEFDPGYDFEAMTKAALEQQEKDFSIRDKSPRERLTYWFSQFDKCIKCYGCRNVCPICYCKECLLEGDRGVIPGGEVTPRKMFHLTRLAHVADSCLNCGQCDSACPMDIPISKLYHMLHQELCQVFGHESGLDMSAPPLAFFTEPERADMATVFERR